MAWKQALTDFRVHLRLERGLSERTVAAYLRDLAKLRNFAEGHTPPLLPEALQLEDLQAFVTDQAKRSQGFFGSL